MFRQCVWRRVGGNVASVIETLSPHARDGFLLQYEAGLPALYDYFRSELGLVRETQPIVPLIELAQSAGFMLPFRDLCLLCQRAGPAQLDPLGRLHAENGPALAWRSGAPDYAWKGRRVPQRVIMAPETIAPEEIDSLTQNAEVRRAIIERLGPERYLAGADAHMLHADETGKLWVKRFRDGGIWAVVEVVNGTPDPDGSRRTYYLRVPPDMTTARQAVAWTYGLDEAEYAAVVRT